MLYELKLMYHMFYSDLNSLGKKKQENAWVIQKIIK